MTAKRIYPLLLVLILAAMLDTCVAAYRTPKRLFAAVAGEETAISGQLEGQVVPSGAGGTIFSENKVTRPALLKTLLRASPEHRGLAIRFVERNGRSSVAGGFDGSIGGRRRRLCLSSAAAERGGAQ